MAAGGPRVSLAIGLLLALSTAAAAQSALAPTKVEQGRNRSGLAYERRHHQNGDVVTGYSRLGTPIATVVVKPDGQIRVHGPRYQIENNARVRGKLRLIHRADRVVTDTRTGKVIESTADASGRVRRWRLPTVEAFLQGAR